MSYELGSTVSYTPSGDEEYMCEAQRLHFAAVLKAWKDRLSHLNDQVVEIQTTEHFADELDQIAHNADVSNQMQARERNNRLIHQIDQALQRIADDDYGYCNHCGVAIGLKRLEARPTAELCIDCKSAQEQKERSFAL